MEPIVKQITAAIREALQSGQTLRIRGGSTKDFYGGPLAGDPLDMGSYDGIVAYEPAELVVTARAGTPLAVIEGTLRDQRQMLAFEPPYFGTAATLGGCVAAGLSGPRRAYAGAVRDFVLGVRMLDGNGNDLRFGGQVMKNVAGFDVSRLLTGSLGTLGVILEVSLKVLPLPAEETTLCLDTSATEAIKLINAWAGQPLPISATSWCESRLHVRLSGAYAAIHAAMKKLGGERVDPDKATGFWQGIREHTVDFFRSSQPLWRLSVKPTALPIKLPGSQLFEWGGALRWLVSDADATSVRTAAKSAGGHATLFRGGDKSVAIFQPLSPVVLTIHRNLKRTFDPGGIFNRGRMYADF
jgi:glycolate oxidase FAD binding subunit